MLSKFVIYFHECAHQDDNTIENISVGFFYPNFIKNVITSDVSDDLNVWFLRAMYLGISNI